MLAVTQVNGCRLCSYQHTNEALKKGVDLAQVESILEGDLAAAPDEELTALVFAQALRGNDRTIRSRIRGNASSTPMGTIQPMPILSFIPCHHGGQRAGATP